MHMHAPPPPRKPTLAFSALSTFRFNCLAVLLPRLPDTLLRGGKGGRRAKVGSCMVGDERNSHQPALPSAQALAPSQTSSTHSGPC